MVLQRGLGDDVPVPEILVASSVTDRAAELLAEEGSDHVALDPVAARQRAARRRTRMTG